MMSLCYHCNAIDIDKLVSNSHRNDDEPHHRTFSELKRSAESCPLCALFVEGLEKRGSEHYYHLADKPVEYRGRYANSPNESTDFRVSKLENRFLTGLWIMCEECSFLLDIYVNEDNAVTAAQKLPGRPVRPAEDFRIAKGWIENCLDNHRRCASTTGDWMPTRLVDVGPVDGSREPRLLCDSKIVGKYLALSHCWGNAVTIQTTTENLQAHKKQIPLVRLTQTFRDAVVITRNLGFLYLWIDSLCIIQNDPRDWETESVLMADIYGNSTVTIAASSSKDSGVGCFFSRDNASPVALEYRTDTELGNSVYVRRPLGGFTETVISGPLNRRAWAFQERLLSKRILDYGKDQLYWECQQTCFCEDGRQEMDENPSVLEYYKPTSILSATATMPATRQAKQGSLFTDWYNFIQNYCRRQLTIASDKFPALSSLASVYAGLTGDRYVAGLWESDMMIGLLWEASYSDRPRLERPPAYRAPSWSWAALDGEILFPEAKSSNLKRILHRNKFALSDINIHIELAGSNPFGRVKSGAMTVSGRLKPVEYEIQSESWEYYNSVMPNMNDPLYSEGKYIGTASFDEAGIHGPLYCLEVCSTGYQLGLLLKSIGADEQYCRVGTATIGFGVAIGIDWFHDAPTKKLTIL